VRLQAQPFLLLVVLLERLGELVTPTKLPSSERDAAHHGTSHTGPEDRRHYFNRLEERGGLRRQPIRSASSLSISGKSVFHLGWFACGGRSGSGDARFEGEYQSMSWAASAFGSESPIFTLPPRIIRNSDRPRASLAKSRRLDWHGRHRKRKPWEGQTVQSKNPERFGGTHISSGLEIKTSHSPSGRGISFFLTSLFIELIGRVCE
jgi:hypothetical protein